MEERGQDSKVLSRRELFRVSGRRGAGLLLVGGGLSAVLAACTTEQDPTVAAAPTSSPTAGNGDPGPVQGRAIVGDVIDFALESDDWAGPFGFVIFRMHRGLVDGNDVYFIRTDASDPDYASQEGLVPVPKLDVLAGTEHVGAIYLPADGGDQPAVLSSEPGREDYTPVFQIHRLRWVDEPRELSSVGDIEAAQADGALEVEETGIVVNTPFVKWSTGELAADLTERTSYLGPGQLLEPPDTERMEVTFKLHECYPAVRYIVTDTDLSPMAEGMAVAHSPRLEGTSPAGATGRTNVFMNGLDGSGPMGFQPSVFDTQAGDPEWSPLWDHMTYAWADGVEPRLLVTEAEIHAARDAGELEEFPGVPDTEGAIFVVNCPVPVLADNTFQP